MYRFRKDILKMSRYNRITVAVVKEGQKDNMAHFRIWVTKGKCKPVYEETMIFDIVNGDPDKFIREVNELLKLLKDEYFNDYAEKSEADRHQECNKKYYEKVKPTYSGRKDWSIEEDNYIRNNMRMSPVEVAKHLGRSVGSVAQRKYKIKHGLLYMK